MTEMNERPSVSVIMAAFNAERFLSAAIESVRAQSMTDWELVVCDDGSTDRTAEIVDAISREDRRVRLVRSPTNLGMSAARNLGFANSRGSAVANLDADDLCTPDRLAKQLEWSRRYPHDIICTGFIHFGAVETQTCDLYLPQALTDAALWVTTPASSGSLWIDRRVFERLGGYRAAVRCDTEDVEFLHRAARGGHRIRVIPEALYLYRIHSNSHCGRARRRFLEAYEAFFETQWDAQLGNRSAREAVFELAMSGLTSSRWPVGRTRLLRRKAAGIAVLLAARFLRFGDTDLARKLLLEALRVCWWRADAIATLAMIPLRCGLQITSIPPRRTPQILLRRNARIYQLA